MRCEESSDDAGEEKGEEAAEESKSQLDLTYEIAELQIAKLPDLYDMELAKLKYPVRWDNSMNTVLCQELLRFNKLTTVIKQSLQDTMDAVKESSSCPRN